MKVLRNMIEIDEKLCDGCGDCVTACHEGAIDIIDGKAKVTRELLCDGFGDCIGECPQGALTIVQREAEPFDEAAVEEHLKNREKEKDSEDTLACGCPSTMTQSFEPAGGCPSSRTQSFRASGSGPKSGGAAELTSALSNWPIQISLASPAAPFFKGADLLIAADCAPLACPNFHSRFLQDKKVLMGCPKLDDAESYVKKLAAIFKENEIKSITAVIMEVPCCSGLPVIIKQALELSGKKIPLEEVVVGIKDGKPLAGRFHLSA